LAASGSFLRKKIISTRVQLTILLGAAGSSSFARYGGITCAIPGLWRSRGCRSRLNPRSTESPIMLWAGQQLSSFWATMAIAGLVALKGNHEADVEGLQQAVELNRWIERRHDDSLCSARRKLAPVPPGSPPIDMTNPDSLARKTAGWRLASSTMAAWCCVGLSRKFSVSPSDATCMRGIGPGGPLLAWRRGTGLC
jgi:hypothetical protein